MDTKGSFKNDFSTNPLLIFIVLRFLLYRSKSFHKYLQTFAVLIFINKST